MGTEMKSAHYSALPSVKEKLKMVGNRGAL